jgi:hypothetical protein
LGQQGAKTKEIFLGDDFGDVAVKANGVSVEIHTRTAASLLTRVAT